MDVLGLSTPNTFVGHNALQLLRSAFSWSYQSIAMQEEVKLVDEIAEDSRYCTVESNAAQNDFASTAWIGWLSLGLGKSVGGLESNAIGVEPSFARRANNWFQGGMRNNAIATSTSQFGVKDHSKSSQFKSVALADESIKAGVDHPTVSGSELTRRRRVIKRQPTGDEADFAVLADSNTVAATKRRGRKNRNIQNTDESRSQDDSMSGSGATTSESSNGTRCKPLLERKATGDEDKWDKVIPASPRRAGRRNNHANQDDSPSRPVVRRQATGDSDTFGGFNRPRASPRRGRKSSMKQEASDNTIQQNDEQPTTPKLPSRPTRRVVDRTPTGDFSEGDPVSPKQGLNDKQEEGTRRSRPVVRRQPTGDASDFAQNVGVPRRGRRKVDDSENDHSQQNNDAMESQPKSRRSRPVVRRQATGDADFSSPRQNFTSPPSRPRRRLQHDEDLPNSQSESAQKSDVSVGSDTVDSQVCPQTSAGQTPESRSRPIVRRQPTGDLGDFSTMSSSPSPTTRKGRRRDSATSHSSSSGLTSPQMITRLGLVRQVTGDGAPLPCSPPQRLQTRGTETQPSKTVAESWMSGDSQPNNGETAAEETNPEFADFDSPNRGIRRTPTGDLNDFFLSESPLKLVGDQFPKAPRRWAGTSPRSSPQSTADNANKNGGEPPRGVKRTPTGDDAEFAMLISMDSDGEESTTGICQVIDTEDDEGKSLRDRNQDEPSRGVKRTPTGDSLDFVAYLDNEMDETVDGCEEADIMRDGSGDNNEDCTVDREVTRGVKRSPTGDDLNFALSLDDEIEQASDSANACGQSTEKADSSPANVNIPVPIRRRGSVQRTPTGDEAEFARMLGVESDEEDEGDADK